MINMSYSIDSPPIGSVVIARILELSQDFVDLSLLQYKGIQASIILCNLKPWRKARVLQYFREGDPIIMCQIVGIWPSCEIPLLQIDCRSLDIRKPGNDKIVQDYFIMRFKSAIIVWINAVFNRFNLSCNDISHIIANIACEYLPQCLEKKNLYIHLNRLHFSAEPISDRSNLVLEQVF